MSKGFTLWFTGLSGAGKSTLANLVAEELRRRGRGVEILDGDEVRTNLSKGLTRASSTQAPTSTGELDSPIAKRLGMGRWKLGGTQASPTQVKRKRESTRMPRARDRPRCFASLRKTAWFTWVRASRWKRCAKPAATPIRSLVTH